MALGLVTLACFLSRPTPTPSPTPSFSALEAQRTVDAMAALRRDLLFPEHLRKEGAARTGDEFDVTQYFTVLQHLSMEEGYVLDYVYHMDDLGGLPVLYARKAEEPFYRTESEYLEAIKRGAAGDYLKHIRVDDSPEGFFQFIVLHIMGGQFYLYWHTNYNDARIICTREALEALLSQPNMFGQDLPGNVRRAARRLDVTPVVEMGPDKVTVRVVIFTHWGGFIRRSYTISRQFPHRILAEEEKTLVPYDCGVKF
ncbi:MAG: hypothetical protein N2508_04110 [Anaerolineae bacterium]|nr:hypothetical protein [Anaerolineae bacterium]